MTTLRITRGLPASGKTTWAKEEVARLLAEGKPAARVNRDELRAMMHGSVYLGELTESQIRSARDSIIGALLRSGVEVYCDDTNLASSAVKDLMKVATRQNADVQVHDQFLKVSKEECILRNDERSKRSDPSVPTTVIEDMHKRYLAHTVAKGKNLPIPAPEAPLRLIPYQRTPGQPKAFLCDLDGTVADANGRDFYALSGHLDDLPYETIIRIVIASAAEYDAEIIFMSGRDERARQETTNWLDIHFGMGYSKYLYMRPEGDQRPDNITKMELFDKHVRDEWDVVAAFDDRNKVVRLWRNLGIVCLAVADGDF